MFVITALTIASYRVLCPVLVAVYGVGFSATVFQRYLFPFAWLTPKPTVSAFID